MERKELKIEIPSGYVIDKANSTFECIKFKPKSLTYEDIANNIFKDQRYFIDVHGEIQDVNSGNDYYDGNNATSEKQLEKLLAINKLMNVAKYLNGDWKPDWGDNNNDKFCLCIDVHSNNIGISSLCINNIASVYFKSRKHAKAAIDILGKDTIRLALSTDW